LDARTIETNRAVLLEEWYKQAWKEHSIIAASSTILSRRTSKLGRTIYIVGVALRSESRITPIQFIYDFVGQINHLRIVKGNHDRF
jgi:hypothetical protein